MVSIQPLHYVHTEPMPGTAANTVQVAKMCAAFQSCGAGVTLTTVAVGSRDVFMSHYGLAESYDLRARSMWKVPGGALLFGLRALFGAGAPRGGVVYTRSVSVAAVAAAFGRPLVLELHVPSPSYRHALQRRLGRILRHDGLLLLVVISERLAADYVTRFPHLRGRVLVAHDGADAVDCDPPPVVALEGRFKVGYVGHLYPGKGMEIIEPLARLCPWATFHVVGGKPADLAHWRDRLGGTCNVILHGHVPHSRTGSYLSAFDVVLAPYLPVVRGSGGGAANLADWMSPLKIFEYMACAKAIVSSDLPVLREVLADGSNALLRAPDDLTGWSTALAGLAADPARRRALGEQARRDFTAKYTWAQRARAILAALSWSLDARPVAETVAALPAQQ